MTLCTQPTPWPGLAFVHNSSWARVICSWWAVQFNWRFTWWGKIWGLLGFPRGKGSVQCVVTGILFGMCVMCCVVDSIRDSCCGVTCPTKFVCDCNGDSIQSQCDVCYSCWYLHTTLKDPLRLRLQGLLQLCSHWFPVDLHWYPIELSLASLQSARPVQWVGQQEWMANEEEVWRRRYLDW